MGEVRAKALFAKKGKEGLLRSNSVRGKGGRDYDPVFRLHTEKKRGGKGTCVTHRETLLPKKNVFGSFVKEKGEWRV